MAVSNTTLKLRYMPGFNNLRHYHAAVRAYVEFVNAKNRVPAYQEFLKAAGFIRIKFRGLHPLIDTIPFMSKVNYVNRYSLESRCVDGRIPNDGVVIDESSGSTGTATNWVRGKKEREANMRIIEFGLKNTVSNEPVLAINAFALGSWATGINITMGCVKFAKVKSTGPDKMKIINTLKDFGTTHQYVIMGYPPFLKQLVDSTDLDWHSYRVMMIFGGEPMSEGMRDHLLKKGIQKIYSSFGASDLELNIAHENEFTVSLRRLLRENTELAKKLLKYEGALPMIFQYNPADFLVETNDKGEMLFTISRPGYLSPKIRYNIYDTGYVLQMKDVQQALTELNLNQSVTRYQTDLPLMFHYGRADMTVAFFGANINPNDIQETIFKIPSLAEAVSSYSIATTENENADKQLIVSIELAEGVMVQVMVDKKLADEFFAILCLLNQDFNAAYNMAKVSNMPKLIFYEFGTGPFTANDIRIKQNYFM